MREQAQLPRSNSDMKPVSRNSSYLGDIRTFCSYTQNGGIKEFETNKNKLHGLSPRANYTDRATAACR
jgi:hypothetical protein